MTFQFTDKVSVGGTRTTKDGFLVADVKIARTGIQIYGGSEVGKPTMDTVRVYRSPEEVFREDAMASFAHRPVTNDHPEHMVDATNWKAVSVGGVGDQVARDGDYVRVPMVLMDRAAIDDFNAGKRELSCGYTCDLDWTPGTTADGEKYDAQQVGITGNHVALVGRGRAGSSCRIGDSWTSPPAPTTPVKDSRMDPALRTVMVDGFSISTTDQGLQAIERLQSQLRDSGVLVTARDTAMATLRTEHQAALDGANGQLAALRTAHQGQLEAKDGEIAALKATHTTELQAKDGEIAALRTQAPTPEALDALVQARGRTLQAARAILGDSYTGVGKTDDQMRRDAATKRMGAENIDGKSDEYVRACFDTLARTLPTGAQDPIRQTLIGDAAPGGSPPRSARNEDPQAARQAANDAWRKRNQELESAWSKPVGQA